MTIATGKPPSSSIVAIDESLGMMMVALAAMDTLLVTLAQWIGVNIFKLSQALTNTPTTLLGACRSDLCRVILHL